MIVKFIYEDGETDYANTEIAASLRFTYAISNKVLDPKDYDRVTKIAKQFKAVVESIKKKETK